MIEQFLNREFMLQVAKNTDSVIEAELSQRAKGRRRGLDQAHPIEEISSSELKELGELLKQLPAQLSGPGAGDDAELAASGVEGTPPRDDFVFLPHNQLMCLVQSAADQVIEERQPQSLERAVESRGGAEFDPVGGLRLRGSNLRVDSDGRRAWKQMEVAKGKWVWLSDPRWVVCLVAELWRDATSGRADFVNRPATVPIQNDAIVILVGDWGSGLERAALVARQIERELAKAPHRQRIVIHLGDVYYSGTSREFRTRFLDPWPVEQRSDVMSFAVPGNHELYSGGHGFFGVALADDRFTRQNGASFFALKSDYWQFLGLDTAYEEGGLEAPQVEWALNHIRDAGPGMRNCLLSHHQLFSAHENGSPLLRRRIKPVLDTGRVDAWFWGHEHRCIQYDESTVDGNRLPFASCVGHGGVPEYLVMSEGESRPRPWSYEYLRKHGDGLEPWNTFGFAVLDLHNEAMTVRYVDEAGRQHHSAVV